MREGITTGYEREFDFAAYPDGPQTSWLLATVPRSGSTYLSHVLWRTGCLGAPLEYLNFEPAGPYGFAAESAQRQAEVWRQVLVHRTSPNGVFGLKGFPTQFQQLQERNFQLLREVLRTVVPGPRSRIVQLRRRDRTAHAISYARALLSGIWRKEQEQGGNAEPEYNALAVERAARLIDVQEDAWKQMFSELRITPLELWYEGAVADPGATCRAVADYIGVRLDPASKVEVPEIERQSQAGREEWTRRHTRG